MLMSMIEHLEPSDPMYDYIVKNSIDMTAQWVKNAYYWDESRRGFKILFNNGVDITDATIRRTGYHGKAGFETFSHYRSIVDKKTFMDLPIRYQKYTHLKEKMLRMFLK